MKKNLTLLIILIILAAVSGMFLYFSEDKEIVSDELLGDFAIVDTSLVDKIFIADTEGGSIELTKDPETNKWRLNGEYDAREDAVELLLKTFNRIEVKSPVPKTMHEGVIKMIAGIGLKVEIYSEGQHAKTYLVGSCTPDHLGTYMVLELPDGRRSSEPLILDLKGNRGCIRQRFFTDVGDWRHTGIFNYNELEIAKIEVVNHEKPEDSFAISYAGGNDIKLHSVFLDKDVPVFDTLAVKDYLLKYKKVHFETFNNHLTPEGQDSVLKTDPAYTLRVTDNLGEVKKVNLFWKKPVKSIFDEEGQKKQWDSDRMFGYYNHKELVLVQRQMFDPLMISMNQFRPKK